MVCEGRSAEPTWGSGRGKRECEGGAAGEAGGPDPRDAGPGPGSSSVCARVESTVRADTALSNGGLRVCTPHRVVFTGW